MLSCFLNDEKQPVFESYPLQCVIKKPKILRPCIIWGEFLCIDISDLNEVFISWSWVLH